MEAWGEGSVGKVLAPQASALEFGSPGSMKKMPGVVAHELGRQREEDPGVSQSS